MLSIQFIAFQMLYKLFFGAQRIYQGQFKHIFVAEFDRWARLDPTPYFLDILSAAFTAFL